MNVRWLVALLVLASVCVADNWKYTRDFDLKKDEMYHLTFQEGSNIKDLYFRWTLHKNEGLVMHLNYDGFVHQFILYERYHRRGYRLQLFKPDPRAITSAPYLWILFQDYNYDTEIAYLRLLVHDGNRNVTLTLEEKVQDVGFRGY